MSDVLPKIKGLFRKIEYPIIYFILVLFVTLEMLALFFPQVKELIKDKTGIFIFLALWLIFLYVAKHLEKLSEKKTLSYTSNFNDAMNTLFKGSNSANEVNLFACDGGFFYNAIVTRGIKINKLKVLLRSSEDNTVFAHPTSKQDQELFRKRLRGYIRHWESLQGSENVYQLNIKAYDFDPSFFFVIVDKKRGFYGFLRRVEKVHNYEVMKCFILTQDTSYEKSFLKDLNAWFDQTFKNAKECK